MTHAEKPPQDTLRLSRATRPSFGTFEYAYRSRRRRRAFMPPQGLLVVAAYLPEDWEVRFVDENIASGARRRFRLGRCGLHQRHAHPAPADPRHQRRAPWLRQADRPGRPFGLGLARNLSRVRLSAYRRARRRAPTGSSRCSTRSRAGRHGRSAAPPTSACRCRISRFRPTQLAQIDRYFLGSVQFSSGCPYRCEFCDIPALYGRNPRLKRRSR